MDAIRLATAQEIEGIKRGSDLNAQSTVIAFDRKGGQSDIAVIRQVTELDPVYYAPETDDRRKALFIWSVENAMRLMGLGAYYFNMPVADEKWQHVVETWGAERLSPGPEYRYIRGLASADKTADQRQ